VPLFLAGLHLFGFCHLDSDGSKVCASYVGESSKLRTYKIHKNLTDIFLKNDATDRCRWCAGQAEALLDLINQL